MAIVQFNPLCKPLRGKVGGLVFKHYADKVVVTRAPTFSGQWSTAQQDGRKRFAQASAYARTVGADPVLCAKYEKIAGRRGLTVRSVVISAFLQGKTAKIETPPPASVCRAPPGRAGLRQGFMSPRMGWRLRTQLLRRRRSFGVGNNEPQITAKRCDIKLPSKALRCRGLKGRDGPPGRPCFIGPFAGNAGGRPGGSSLPFVPLNATWYELLMEAGCGPPATGPIRCREPDPINPKPPS